MKRMLFPLACLLTLFQQSHAQTVGLITNNPGQLDGYVLFAPTRSDSTYLIDKCGKRVHTWFSNRKPGLSAYLLPDGNLLRTEALNNPVFSGNGSSGGRIAIYDWNSTVLWSYIISSTTEIQNHDVWPMPNGNILVAIWENIDSLDCIAAGRNPALLSSSIWSAKIVELQPIGTNQANIVWQWRLWDHLIQDFDNTKSSFGIVADHPEKLNVNFIGSSGTNPDWIHLNAVTYNASLDQVMISSHNLSELWILDHSTTTLEAATGSGGVHGKGGDFIYRWGNPAAYNRGTSTDQKFFLQHNPYWIPAGYKDENKIMIFNNGVGRPGGNAASVDIIEPPVDVNGNYTLMPNQPYGPATTSWSYMASPNPSTFFSMAMGGAERLSNGNTLICEAMTGEFFEVDSLSQTVWKYINPVGQTGPVAQGTTNASGSVFRANYFPSSYTGFAGHTLTAGDPIELNPNPYTCPLQTSVEEMQMLAGDELRVYVDASGMINLLSKHAFQHTSFQLIDATGRLVEMPEAEVVSVNELKFKPAFVMQSGLYFLRPLDGTQRAVRFVFVK